MHEKLNVSLHDLKTTVTLDEFYDYLEMIEADEELEEIRQSKRASKSGAK